MKFYKILHNMSGVLIGGGAIFSLMIASKPQYEIAPDGTKIEKPSKMDQYVESGGWK